MPWLIFWFTKEADKQKQRIGVLSRKEDYIKEKAVYVKFVYFLKIASIACVQPHAKKGVLFGKYNR